MTDWPLLSTVVFLPLIGAGFILLIRGDEATVARNARSVALWTSVITFLISLLLWTGFDSSTAAFQFVEKAEWFPGYGIDYHLGIDGISLWFVLLTTLLIPICVLASWESITKRVKEYMIAFLAMETLIIGSFVALDFVLFYFFFEAMLIPLFLIIGIWGGKRRIYASFKFFLYTMLGSVLMLVALLYMYFQAGTTDIPTLMATPFGREAQIFLWLAMFASFAVKMPMWPVHTWLPDAHVEAPTAGSVLLAGILLKVGGYGFLRFSLPMLPDASQYFAPLIFGLSMIAVVYTSLVALVQGDMKKLIAYSSVAHMGFVTIGIYTFNTQGIEGSIIQMLSHGLVSGALFLCVGVVYDRMHTRDIDRYGGLVNRMPGYALIFLFFTMASIGLPGTSGFVGEFLVLVGAFQANTWVAFIAATGVILGACYMLWLYRRVVFGELVREDLKGILDMNRREVLAFAPLVVLTLWMGIYPETFLEPIRASVANLLTQVQVEKAAMVLDTVNQLAQR
ncbi:NADH-quinone oxidoreductase subunit M [Tistrella mobilis]|uniref:NADH-quinone oxidoreductase subunit M n=1 Tax=Tistrella mobilis TaxID=171437 RepID=UPI0035563829